MVSRCGRLKLEVEPQSGWYHSHNACACDGARNGGQGSCRIRTCINGDNGGERCNGRRCQRTASSRGGARDDDRVRSVDTNTACERIIYFGGIGIVSTIRSAARNTLSHQCHNGK